MKAISYIRCSTEGQATGGVSLQNQTEAIHRYAAFKGFDILEEITDAGISGGVNRARDGFLKLLDRIQAGDVEVVLLYSLERLSRDMLTLLCSERLLCECSVQLHTADAIVDTSTPDGWLTFAMKCLLAEHERRQVGYRTRKAMQHKKGNGKVFNHTPYGYQRQGETLIPDRNEQGVIKTVNDLYQDGTRLVDIVAHLNKQNIPTKQGGTWSPQQVKRLIASYENTFKKGQTKLISATRALIEAIA
jgi:site-specific DNA recombinase